MSKKAGHKAKKHFGQNFLHDMRVIDNIIASMVIRPRQNVVEIGPGQGALTEGLLEKNDGYLNVVELDRDLLPILRTKFFNYPEFTIHQADALNFDFKTLYDNPEFTQEDGSQPKLRVAGNLPYNISTPLLFHLLDNVDQIQDMHFMLQKEVVDRICALAGENNFGRLSVMIQYYCRAEYLFTVGPECFDPAPKVDSAILRLTPRAPSIKAVDEARLSEFVRMGFQQRRKTLRNNLKKVFSAESIEACGIDPGLRPEKVTVDQFVTMANKWCELGCVLPASE
jgi:16S rRNA (adenine1518-N6/adenine1519-N6)-dimethyltransferase